MSEWISVKDRLPDKLEPVNIVWVNREPEPYYSHIKDKPFVSTGYYHNGKWWWYSCVCEDYLAYAKTILRNTDVANVILWTTA